MSLYVNLDWWCLIFVECSSSFRFVVWERHLWGVSSESERRETVGTVNTVRCRWSVTPARIACALMCISWHSIPEMLGIELCCGRVNQPEEQRQTSTTTRKPPKTIKRNHGSRRRQRYFGKEHCICFQWSGAMSTRSIWEVLFHCSLCKYEISLVVDLPLDNDSFSFSPAKMVINSLFHWV